MQESVVEEEVASAVVRPDPDVLNVVPAVRRIVQFAQKERQCIFLSVPITSDVDVLITSRRGASA